MGRYKGKRLKQNPGIVRSVARYIAAFRYGGENTAETAAAAPDVPDAALSPHEEAPVTAETAAAAPEAQNVAAPPREEGPIAAEATAGTSPPADAAAALLPQKKQLFLTALAVYGAILLAVTLFLQGSLWRFLANSQAEMDRQAAERAAQQAMETALRQAPQRAFEDWLSGLTADYWTDLWYAKASVGLDARGSVREFMAERFSPDAAQAYRAAGFTAEAPVYILKNGEDSLARVTLAGSELNWSVSDVELLIEGVHSASVTVAEGCRVYCNGREMGGEYTENAVSRFRYEPLEGRLEGAVTWISYSVEGLLLEPELTVVPPEGYRAVRTEDGDYLLGMAGDAGVYTDKSVDFVRAYLYYYMRGSNSTRANMNSVLSHLTAGTQAYQDIRDTYNGVYWSPAYTGIDTSNTVAGDVLVWADNCFSVDVTYDADCISKGAHYDYADATMRIYFLRTDEGYIISNFVTL